jgi:hypothetical protein
MNDDTGARRHPGTAGVPPAPSSREQGPGVPPAVPGARRPRSGEPESETLSGPAILCILALLALVVTGGYFFLLKMIDVSQQDDCVLANRHNCGASSEPFRR